GARAPPSRAVGTETPTWRRRRARSPVSTKRACARTHINGMHFMTSGRDVVISGLGAVSAFGRGAEAFWRGALGGATAIREGRFGFAATCDGGVDALAAAREAIEDAQLEDLADVALVVGTTTGGVPAWLEGAQDARIAYHAPAAALARALGIGGPLLVPSVACASG